MKIVEKFNVTMIAQILEIRHGMDEVGIFRQASGARFINWF
jgi:hypothetical protein